ncbi:MAG: hypothetical protein F6K23_31130 [Okeania sp. SIO2C9]|uniref:hypothetical protein n=1 Tax=Okeania sp. SIO2C9 TaxID=2607791 RepID=UPI0013C14DE3|nr:hypothetical protein [Okeania sp. SIO2C9]NEQ77074.1 hypothetical protein [Okeania sp. SIO2C9]
MRIENLRTEELGERRRVAADIIWETAKTSAQVLYFEAPYPFAEDLQPSANAFVLASLPFAVWLGEKRIFVQGSICPRLYSGLDAAMAIYQLWYDHCQPLTIEPQDGLIPSYPRTTPYTGCFLSGGVDGLTTLRNNRLNYPLEHPESIRECLLFFGVNEYDFNGSTPVPERLSAFEIVTERLTNLGKTENFQLIPIHVNARSLCPSYECFTSIGFSAANIAVAHAFNHRFSKILFASDGVGLEELITGGNPLLINNFSSAGIQIQVEEYGLTRIQKLKILAQWQPGLNLMQPCHQIKVLPKEKINCGYCEKCVRTMLGLLILSKLAESEAFVENDVTPKMINNIPVSTEVKANFLSSLIDPLENIGRQDLVKAIKFKILKFKIKQYLKKLNFSFT